LKKRKEAGTRGFTESKGRIKKASRTKKETTGVFVEKNDGGMGEPKEKKRGYSAETHDRWKSCLLPEWVPSLRGQSLDGRRDGGGEGQPKK